MKSWNDGNAKQAITAFVAKVTNEGSPDFVPVAERIATFDNDGTLWCEQPMPVQFYFALYEQAKKDGWTVISMKDDWKPVFAFEK
jgi:hypothetical protein